MRTDSRENARALVESSKFHQFVILVIIIDAIAVGAATFDLAPEVETALRIIDYICLLIYVIEMFTKFYAWHGDYFKDGWNVFDFIIIVASLAPDWLLPIPIQVARILRLFRVGRIFKLVSAFRQLRIIVEAIGRSMSGVAWTALLLILVMYVFDVAGICLFGDVFPQYFDNLGNGFFTLFEILTLEGWNSIAHDVMDVFPAAWIYFVSYVVISAFIMINVVLGIILNAVDESIHNERINQFEDADTQLLTELNELKEQVETVRYLLEKRDQALISHASREDREDKDDRDSQESQDAQ